MIEGKKIFITGGAGFIGSTLVGELYENNEVVVFDNLSRNALCDKPYCNSSNVTVVEGDVENYEELQDAMQGADYVVHCAGIAGIDTVIQRPTKTMTVNIIGSANVFKAAQTLQDCKRVVCFSTSEIFGPQAISSKETDQAVVGALGQARWTYAVSKLAEEHLAVAYYKEYGLPTTVVRPFNVYGPGQVGEGAIKIFIDKALKNEPLTVYGDGSQIRAWCYVDDMVRGTFAVMEDEAAIGESFNIGNARSVLTIYGLASTVIRVAGSSSEIQYAPPLNADIEFRIPCVDKAREVLGFEADVTLDAGLKATVDWYASQLEG